MSVTQGERGPPGNNGEKGERGDYVSHLKIFKINIMPLNLYQFESSCCACVFQGEPGEDGLPGERVNYFLDFLALIERHRPACALISVTILRREQLERRASKVPVETEAREDQW